MAVERKTDKDAGGDEEMGEKPNLHLKKWEGVREQRLGGVPGFKEQPQIQLLLTVFKNAITSKFQLIPGVLAEFVGRAIPILLRPSHALFKPLNKFLLQIYF